MSKSRLQKLVIAAAALAAVYGLSMPARAQSPAETLYKSKCAMCHGADGKGDTPAGKKMGARDFTSPEVQKQTDAQLSEVISDGKKKMPAYEKSLKPAQIKDLVSYIRDLAKKK